MYQHAFMLNSTSPIPLYCQLADILLAKIRSGEYLPESRIPSENSLAQHYGIGRPTARQATDLLVRKRILIRKRGSGTFVCKEKKEVDLFSLAGTLSSFHKEGISVATRILKKITLKSIGNDPENPFANKKAYFFSRLSRVENVPVLIEDIYLHETLFAKIDSIDLSGRSLSQIVDEIASKVFTDVDGKVKPLLAEDERVKLKVKKGSLDEEERKEIESHVTDKSAFCEIL